MDEKRRTKISKFLSLILRHAPETVGLRLGENGWVRIDELLAACAKNGKTFTRQELEEVVETNDKKRFSFDTSGTKIRANQGHSVEVEIEFEQQLPPAVLYHGTAEKNVNSILKTGLQKMRRHHVHLSSDKETARRVGTRYGKPVIFEIDTKAMLENGFEFFVSANGVWLIENVPPHLLRLTENER
ncbi:MAG: RNA 2'-phosphotransferase [Acidobacteriota bacterium]|nr:RNA 2'-phosphotransferase [Acidobacteriota bacterium]